MAHHQVLCVRPFNLSLSSIRQFNLISKVPSSDWSLGQALLQLRQPGLNSLISPSTVAAYPLDRYSSPSARTVKHLRLRRRLRQKQLGFRSRT